MKDAAASSGSRRRIIAILGVLMGAALLATPGVVPVARAEACCQVTEVSGNRASARDRRTGTTFQFTLTRPIALRVGDAVYANFRKKEVSLDGSSICGTITAISPGAPSAPVAPRTPAASSGPAQPTAGNAGGIAAKPQAMAGGTSSAAAPAGTSAPETSNMGMAPAAAKIAVIPPSEIPIGGLTGGNTGTSDVLTPHPIPVPNINPALFGPFLQSMTIGIDQQPSQSSVSGGRTDLNVFLTMAAPGGYAGQDFQVSLSSDQPNVLSVPASVSFRQLYIGAPITSTPVAVNTPVTITAQYAGKQLQASVTVIAVNFKSLTFTPSSVTGGNASQGNLLFLPPGSGPPGGISVSLSSSNPNLVQVPANVTIPAGSKTGTFLAITKSVSSSTNVTVSAIWNNPAMPFTAQLTLQPPGSAPASGHLYIYSVNLYDSSGNLLTVPTAGQPFQMCINVYNGGAGMAAASTLTVQETTSDNSYSNSWQLSIPQLASGAGTGANNPCISPQALNSGITYDFNFYDPSTNFLSDVPYSM